MRLIDADELIEQIEADAEHIEDTLAKMFLYANISDIKHAPTIAQPEIVRCKDCKHYYNTNPEQIATANIICHQMHEDDYCSYAERREVSE